MLLLALGLFLNIKQLNLMLFYPQTFILESNELCMSVTSRRPVCVCSEQREVSETSAATCAA